MYYLNFEFKFYLKIRYCTPNNICTLRPNTIKQKHVKNWSWALLLCVAGEEWELADETGDDMWVEVGGVELHQAHGQGEEGGAVSLRLPAVVQRL